MSAPAQSVMYLLLCVPFSSQLVEFMFFLNDVVFEVPRLLELTLFTEVVQMPLDDVTLFAVGFITRYFSDGNATDLDVVDVKKPFKGFKQRRRRAKSHR